MLIPMLWLPIVNVVLDHMQDSLVPYMMFGVQVNLSMWNLFLIMFSAQWMLHSCTQSFFYLAIFWYKVLAWDPEILSEKKQRNSRFVSGLKNNFQHTVALHFPLRLTSTCLEERLLRSRMLPILSWLCKGRGNKVPASGASPDH